MRSASQGGKRKRAKRTALLTKTALRDEAGGAGDARIRNLSEKGLGGVTNMKLAPGLTVSITLKGIGSVKGRVVWTSGKSFGMEFAEPIDLDQLHMPSGDIVQAPPPFSVASRYQPVQDYKRPGFTHRR
ncbi:PilZ domain-containing protein [Parasphingopyxis sp.]|uniref:PilZ domain-containing protein n=1 Tax=Parasphingopyxis sp. TaxID=1920299 RepID=UPI002611A19D|nr:PilZ domain-containing protein [Parasphingopyxis sp.]